VEALTTYDTYGDAEHARHRNRKDFDGRFRWGVLRWCILAEESSDKTVASAR